MQGYSSNGSYAKASVPKNAGRDAQIQANSSQNRINAACYTIESEDDLHANLDGEIH
jgi:hypothetical protein